MWKADTHWTWWLFLDWFISLPSFIFVFVSIFWDWPTNTFLTLEYCLQISFWGNHTKQCATITKGTLVPVGWLHLPTALANKLLKARTWSPLEWMWLEGWKGGINFIYYFTQVFKCVWGGIMNGFTEIFVGFSVFLKTKILKIHYEHI